MKKELQIIGADVVSKNLMKITCIPFTTQGVKEKKVSLMKIAMDGGGIQDILQKTQDVQMQKSIFFVSMDDWLSVFKNRLLSHVVVDIDMKEAIL